MAKKFEYSTVLVKGTQNGVFAEFPFDSFLEFGTRKPVPVRITFDGYFVQMNLLPCGNNRHWIHVRKEIRTAIGKEEGDTTDKWEFEIHQPKFNQENFVTSTAADTQIAIATGISPDLLGLMYGNSKGGSMQRELLLLQYALSWESRQQLADPIEMMLKINNPALTNLELRFRNTFLTTLDSGAGSATTLS